MIVHGCESNDVISWSSFKNCFINFWCYFIRMWLSLKNYHSHTPSCSYWEKIVCQNIVHGLRWPSFLHCLWVKIIFGSFFISFIVELLCHKCLRFIFAAAFMAHKSAIRKKKCVQECWRSLVCKTEFVVFPARCQRKCENAVSSPRCLPVWFADIFNLCSLF